MFSASLRSSSLVNLIFIHLVDVRPSSATDMDPVLEFTITMTLPLTCRSHQPYRFVPAENAHHRSVRAPPSTFSVIYNAGTPTTVKTAVDYVLNLVRSAVLRFSALVTNIYRCRARHLIGLSELTGGHSR